MTAVGRRRIAIAGLLLATSVGAVGCTDDAGGATTEVTGTDDACELAADVLQAGPIEFAFTNEGSTVSELYVLREDDEIVGEVENVGPGTSRALKVDLVKGTYAVRCKPGQTGDGITTPFTVTGEGGTAQAEPDRTIAFDAVDFEYEELDLAGITAGTTIRFEMTNSGTQPHEFEVLDPEGTAIGEVAAVDAGGSGGATVTFDDPGTYRYQCILVDPETGDAHTAMGMEGTFEVGPA